MSLNSAMLAGVTGLTANAAALSTTSNNIANVNTVGYKEAQTEFSNLVSANGSGDNSGGVQANSTTYVTQQGLLQSTSSATDLAVSGQGFFVTTQTPTGLTATSPRLFTRAGSFTVDSQGYLKNSAGLYLTGWIADANGAINTDPSNINLLQPINVATAGGAAGATTTAGVNANVNANQTISQAAIDAAGVDYAALVAGGGTIPSSADPAAVAVATAIGGGGAAPTDAYDPTSTTTSMAAYNATTGTGTKPDFSVTIPVADSQGGQRSIEVDFLKSDEAPNQWYAEARVVPASDVTTGTGLVDGQISTGVVAFTPDGRLDPANTTLFGGNSTVTIGASNATAPSAGNVNWASNLGINGQTISLNLAGGAGGLTQYNSQSVVQSVQTNGTAFGNLTSINIGSDGQVTANFDNGVTREIAQVALATFPNPDGLNAVSGDAYSVSLASGTYNLKTPGSGGAGSLQSSSLEASTVDLSTEFSNLITTQQAYSASSKIITTADQMMQDLINIIR
jgi:flagellar hook protein FlgE